MKKFDWVFVLVVVVALSSAEADEVTVEAGEEDVRLCSSVVSSG